MNRSIRLVAVFAIILTIILLINLTVVQAFQEDKYANHPANQRGFYDSQTIARGQISAGGQVLAESLPNADETYTRNYPTNPPAFSTTVGYLSDLFGASHLEQSHNDILNGTDPSLLSTNWRDVITGKQPHGANLELTIDPHMQQFAYQQLATRERRWPSSRRPAQSNPWRRPQASTKTPWWARAQRKPGRS